MREESMYKCPVCNYKGLYEPAYSSDKLGYSSNDICPCCGFQFGLDDFDFDSGDWYNPREKAFEIWRKKWIEEGAEFHSRHERPKDWDVKEQLKDINIYFET